jgi:hypothetical protein
MVEAAEAFTRNRRPQTPPKASKKLFGRSANLSQNAKNGSPNMASLNAVVGLLENCKVAKKWQCRYCSLVQEAEEAMFQGAKCEFCELPMVSQAPDNAVTSILVMRQAIATRDNVEASLNETTTTSKQQELTSTLSSKSSKRHHQWPTDVTCLMCESSSVEKYCFSCKC